MIVLSPNLVLTKPTKEFSADNPVIGWRNVVTTQNLSSTTADVDKPLVNLANPSTYLKWAGTSVVDEEFLTVQMQTEDDVDYLAIVGHNFGTARIGIELQVAEEEGVFTTVLSLMPSDDRVLIFRFAPKSYHFRS